MNPNHTLRRISYTANGVFGNLFEDETSNICAVTLEHSFLTNNGYAPKLARGIYTCKLGQHQLEGMSKPFMTYEVQNVPDFMGKPVTGILIHVGNFNLDSNGCILVGEQIAMAMITGSRKTFDAFMQKMAGIDQFQLTVK